MSDDKYEQFQAVVDAARAVRDETDFEDPDEVAACPDPSLFVKLSDALDALDAKEDA